MLFDGVPSRVTVSNLTQKDKLAFLDLSVDARADLICRLRYALGCAEHATKNSQRIKGSALPAEITQPLELALNLNFSYIHTLSDFATYTNQANTYLARADKKEKGSILAIEKTLRTVVPQLEQLHRSAPAPVLPRSEDAKSAINALAILLSQPMGSDFNPELASEMTRFFNTLGAYELLQLKEFGSGNGPDAPPRLLRELRQSGMKDRNTTTFRDYCAAAIMVDSSGIYPRSSAREVQHSLELSHARQVA